MRISLIFIIILVIFGCSDEISFAPKVKPGTTYSFIINDPSGSQGLKYDLQVVAHSAVNTAKDTYVFYLEGRNKEKRETVYISGTIGTYNSYLNIHVSSNGISTFYKDCNQFRCEASEGKDEHGSYLRIKNLDTCVTTTLASDRSMTIKIFNIRLNPLTLYLQ